MTDVGATSNPVVEFEVVVLRCRCGDPDSHNGKNGPARPCPQAEIEDYGVVASNEVTVEEASRLKRLWKRVKGED